VGAPRTGRRAGNCLPLSSTPFTARGTWDILNTARRREPATPAYIPAYSPPSILEHRLYSLILHLGRLTVDIGACRACRWHTACLSAGQLFHENSYSQHAYGSLDLLLLKHDISTTVALTKEKRTFASFALLPCTCGTCLQHPSMPPPVLFVPFLPTATPAHT